MWLTDAEGTHSCTTFHQKPTTGPWTMWNHQIQQGESDWSSSCAVILLRMPHQAGGLAVKTTERILLSERDPRENYPSPDPNLTSILFFSVQTWLKHDAVNVSFTCFVVPGPWHTLVTAPFPWFPEGLCRQNAKLFRDWQIRLKKSQSVNEGVTVGFQGCDSGSWHGQRW